MTETTVKGLFGGAATLVVLATTALATPVPDWDIPALVGQSDTVVAGAVRSIVPIEATSVAIGGGRTMPAVTHLATLSVGEVLKGPPTAGAIEVKFVSQGDRSGPPGYGPVSVSAYRVFFLRRAGDHYEFVSPFHPSVIAAPRVDRGETLAVDKVASAISAVLTSRSIQADRMSAVYSLCQFRSTSAVAGLKRAFEDTDSVVRETATGCLIAANDLTALAAAKTLLLQPDSGVSKEILARLRDSIALHLVSVDAIPLLAELMASSNPENRRAAAAALGHTGSMTVVPILARGLRDDDPEVQFLTVFALHGVTGDGSRPIRSVFPERASAHLSYWDQWMVQRGLPR